MQRMIVTHKNASIIVNLLESDRIAVESVIVQSASPAHELVRAIFYEHLSFAGKLQHTAQGCRNV